MIRCVIFDLDGTIYDYDSAHAAGYKSLQQYAVSHLGWAAGEFDSLYDRAMSEIEEELGRDSAAIHDRFLRFQRMMEYRGESLSHVWPMNAAYWDTFMDLIAPYPGICDALDWLRQNEYRTGIGTNMTVDYQLKKLEKLGLIDAFDFVVISEETGKEKPSGGFFDRCARKAGCRPDECLFIGDDHQKDVEGALQAGMQALWFTGQETPEEHISDYWQLIERMKS
ncbi:MAG: HAD family hydrolase [Sarcina sp.]|nr:HAD family hydrolase [Sarcina sp.]